MELDRHREHFERGLVRRRPVPDDLPSIGLSRIAPALSPLRRSAPNHRVRWQRRAVRCSFVLTRRKTMPTSSASQPPHNMRLMETASLFKPRRARLDAHLFDNSRIGLPLTLFYRIDIPLEPLTFDGKTERTSVQMDFIRFAVPSWRQLPGREFRFPVNPEEGYIEGSIYLAHAHHPADTTRIAFGDLHENVIAASVDITFDFTLESGSSALGVFSVSWPVELECQPEELDALMKEADEMAARR